MKTKQQHKLAEYHVERCWTVDYRSTCVVHAASAEEAARLALEDGDYDDAESCDGSEGPTEIWRVVEVTPDGDEIERDVSSDRDEETVTLSRCEAAALCSSVEMALRANGGDCPDGLRVPLLEAVEKLNAAFDFGIA